MEENRSIEREYKKYNNRGKQKTCPQTLGNVFQGRKHLHLEELVGASQVKNTVESQSKIAGTHENENMFEKLQVIQYD